MKLKVDILLIVDAVFRIMSERSDSVTVQQVDLEGVPISNSKEQDQQRERRRVAQKLRRSRETPEQRRGRLSYDRQRSERNILNMTKEECEKKRAADRERMAKYRANRSTEKQRAQKFDTYSHRYSRNRLHIYDVEEHRQLAVYNFAEPTLPAECDCEDCLINYPAHRSY